ncbi:hypothetical protein A9Q86_13340 [Flavobacteriales bacterium 33_180_T64]|nr:hypothetical protein A9Q86_13340 [Flavobacteriales bacterium 33_180_T64]
MNKKKLLLKLFLLFCVVTTSAQIGNESQGTGSGVNITSGDYNTLYGDSSGFSLTSGLHTTFIGYNAGKSHTSQRDNTFIGAYAGEFATTGTDNVFIGAFAARYCNGTDNTVIGVEAGMVMTNGASDNTIVGEEAGQALLDGDDNVFIGEDAGYNTTTASDNTFVGSTSGRSNTTGYANAFFGDEAGYDNTTGYKNTAVGDSAGIDNGVGRLNTFIGQGAGCATEHADYNTFVGNYAGGDNNRNNNTSNANRNTFVGVFNGFTNREGEDNVGMGAFANYSQSIDILNITGQWGGPVSSGNPGKRSRTTFVGAQSYPNNSDVIAIGYKARVDGRYGITLGNESRAESNYSVAIGQGVHVNQLNTMALGGDTITNRLSVGIGTVAANANASLELADTDKGFLVNRLTTVERIALETAAANGLPIDATQQGLMVYDTDLNALVTWNGTTWNALEANTDAQDLTLASDVLSLTNDATTIDLSPYLDNTDTQDLSLSGSTLSISNGTGVDLSGLQDGTGTDAQALSLVTNTLSITGNASTVDLASYLDNTDTQDLSLSGSTLSISNGTGVDLSGLQDGTGTDAQALSLVTNTLSITGNASTVDLASYLDNTDTQDLSLSGSTLSISNGTGVDLSTLQDGTGTDAQNLTSASLSGNTLTVAIENGTSVNVDLSPILNTLESQNTAQQTQIDDLITRLTILEACACQTLDTEEVNTNRNSGPILYQNIPNPFNGTTSIKYYVPTIYKRAAIVFSNTAGQVIDNVSLKDLGENEMFFNSDSLAAGMYYYTLFVEGKKIDSKKMIIE